MTTHANHTFVYTVITSYTILLQYTVNGERFAGLNFRDFLAYREIFPVNFQLQVSNKHWWANAPQKYFREKLQRAETANVQPSESFPVYGITAKHLCPAIQLFIDYQTNTLQSFALLEELTISKLPFTQNSTLL